MVYLVLKGSFMDLVRDIFTAWKNGLYEKYGHAMYLSKGRQEPIEDLVQELLEMKIPYEEARSIANKIETALVTKKGLTVSKKDYQGWKENAKSDFLAALYLTYKENNLIPLSELTPEDRIDLNPVFVANRGVFEKHELIEIWGKQKFPEIWNDKMSYLTNQKESSLNNFFLDDFFG